MTALRGLALAVLVVVAVTLQVAVLHYVSIYGVVPNLALLLVVAAALVRGPEYAAVVGFVSGLVLDLAPPADHTAGRWALALVIAGYLAGRVRMDARQSRPAALITVAACSFVATSCYALSGLVLGDTDISVAQMLPVILMSLVWDVAVAAVLLNPTRRLLERLRPPRVAY